MEQSIIISPFSHTHYRWKIEWKRLPSTVKMQPSQTTSKKKRKALEAIASVGVIGGKQLQQLFHLPKATIQQMEARKLLIKHYLFKVGHNNDQRTTIYTLGPAGANSVMPEFMPNYWVEYDTEAVLNRLMFFHLYSIFKHKKAGIRPAPKPFAGSLEINNNLFYVYCTRGDVSDLQMLLKWKSFNERLIIVTEALSHLKPFELFLQMTPMKLRVITDVQLISTHPQFYIYQQNEVDMFEWILESSL